VSNLNSSNITSKEETEKIKNFDHINFSIGRCKQKIFVMGEVVYLSFLKKKREKKKREWNINVELLLKKKIKIKTFKVIYLTLSNNVAFNIAKGNNHYDCS